MASLSSATLSEPQAQANRDGHGSDATLVLDCGNPVAADFAAYLRARYTPGAPDQQAAAVVLFLGPRLGERERRTIDEALQNAAASTPRCIGIVSSFRIHLGARGPREAEDYAVSRARPLGGRVVLFRPGHVLATSSAVSARLRRFSCLYPLVPRRLHGCCVDGAELFAAMAAELDRPEPRRLHTYTLLGANRPWRDVLAEHRGRGVVGACVTGVCMLLSLLLIGHVAAFVVSLLARRLPSWRWCKVGTLRPGSFRELLALYNPYNACHVQVVGYNNGVVHFGQRYPGKTIVSTVGCGRVALVGRGTLKADAGATVRRALDLLGPAGLELPVVPNYSYVCLGTSFFVPIHGSASDFSTLADTIARVVLYDARRDRLVTAACDEPDFRDHVYNRDAGVLLLRLYLRVRPKERYFVQAQIVDNPGAAELIAALCDTRAANVEIRKARAGSRAVTIARYYTGPDHAASALELPRDRLGRLWDRLEENPVTSFLMHALTRHLAWHVELFFTTEDFARFWDSHRALPLKKLQLRYIRRDGWPHSPFRDHDCVSVDLFMLRLARRRFEHYLQQTFGAVASNPGKHSR
jgi:hypothetical protein